MRALVVNESMYGNTHVVAVNIAAGHGYRLLTAPESFFVSKQGTLLEGEAARACAYGVVTGEESGSVASRS